MGGVPAAAPCSSPPPANSAGKNPVGNALRSSPKQPSPKSLLCPHPAHMLRIRTVLNTPSHPTRNVFATPCESRSGAEGIAFPPPVAGSLLALYQYLVVCVVRALDHDGAELHHHMLLRQRTLEAKLEDAGC